MDYVKTAIKRGLIGIPFGVFINFTFIIVFGYIFKDTNVEIYVSGLISQYIIGGLLGFLYASSSVIFEVEEWNFTSQTILHFLVTMCLGLVPGAMFAGWIKKDIISLGIFISIGVVVYFVIWLMFKMYWDRTIKNVNRQINK